MGCTASNHHAHILGKSGSTSQADQNQQLYAAVKKRATAPGASREDGYDVGLRVRENVAAQYSLYLGTSRKDGVKVSMKEYFLYQGDADLENRIILEVAILSRVAGHVGFPTLRELFIVEGQSLFIVTDYIDTFRLKNYLDFKGRKSTFTLVEVRKIFKSLVSIAVHAQEKGIVLRNLSLDTILAIKKTRRNSKEKTGNSSPTAADYDIKLTDLSQAVDHGSSHVLTDHPLFDWNSQLFYCAPEIVMKQPYSYSADVWSLGVILFALIAGELPFFVEDYMDRAKLIDKIKNGEYTFGTNPEAWNAVPKEVRMLVQSMLLPDPMLRANLAEIRRNEWVQSNN